MKLLSLVLAGSLVVNAAFVTFVLVKRSSLTAAFSPAPGPTLAPTMPVSGRASTDAARPAAETAQLAQLWTQLHSSDLSTLVARLRAAGFSSALIRTIVSTQVNEQFSARRKTLLGEPEERPFWKSQNNVARDPKTVAALRELSKEQAALTKSLLEGSAGDDVLASQRRRYGDLPTEKLSQLQRINSDYDELNSEIYSKTNGIILPEDREKLAYLQKEKLADIAKTLTPQEYEDFQLRSSNTANQLRSQLSSFNATESEFRAIYKLQAAFDAQYNSNDGAPLSQAVMRDRTEAQKQLQASILAALPPDRVTDYKQAIDPNYQQVNRLVTRLALPPVTTQQILAVHQDIQQRANTTRADRTLTPDTRNALLAALAQEATAKLTTNLTPRGLEAYKQNGGSWLDQLVPRATPPPTAGAKLRR